MNEWLFIATAALVSGLIQGLTGMGYSLVLVALVLAFGIDILTASMLAMFTAGVCQLTIIWRLRERFDWQMMWPVIVGSALGTPLGLWILSQHGRSEWLGQVFGGFVAAVALWLAFTPARLHGRKRCAPGWGLGSGLVTGLAGGLFSTGGPPAVMYIFSRPVPLNIAKVCAQWLFLGIVLYRTAIAIPTGMLSGQVVLQGLVAMPATLVGSLLGVKIARRIHPEWLRKSVYILLVIVGLRLLLS